MPAVFSQNPAAGRPPFVAHPPGRAAIAGAARLRGPDFRAQFTDAADCRALLGWIAARHAAESAEFIRP